MSAEELSDSVSSTHTTATACVEDAHIEDPEENRRLYEANLACAREILAMVENMGLRQQQWHVELTEHFMVEALQQQQSAELTGKVSMAEEELLNQPRYVDKVAAVESNRDRGSLAISLWYTNDDLLKATPFACCVPFPRGISDAARSTVAEQVNAFNLQTPYYIETADFTASLVDCAGIVGCAPDNGGATSESGAPYLAMACQTGADVLAVVDKSEALRAALDKTPVLLLHDLAAGYPSAARRQLRRRGSAQADDADGSRATLSRGFVVGGVLVAIEVAQHRSSAWASLAANLGEFAADNVLGALPRRSYVFHTTSHVTPSGPRHALLNIDHLDRAAYDCFTLEELVTSAQLRATDPSRPPALRFTLDKSHPPLASIAPESKGLAASQRGHSSATLAATVMATAAATAALSWAVLRAPGRR